MQTPSLEQAQRILKDKRYSAAKRKAARLVIREAKGSTKSRSKSKSKSKKLARRSKSRARNPRKSKAKTKSSKRKTRGSKSSRSRSKKGSRKLARRSKNPSRTTRSRSSRKLGGKRIRFYDPRTKKYVNIPRSACKLKRNKNPRGRNRIVAMHKGKKYSTAAPKGFKL